MPLLRRRWGIADPFDGTSLAAHILKEDQIILQRIGAKNEIVAVELQIEDYASGLIDAPCYRFKPNGDLALFEVLQLFEYGERKVCVRLNIIQKFGVSFAIKCSRFIRQSSGGLSLGPFPPSTTSTLLFPSLPISQFPTAGTKLAGSAPTVSAEKSSTISVDLLSAALSWPCITKLVVRQATATAKIIALELC